MSLYTELRDAGCELDNYYSDLYVKVTPESTAVLIQHHRRSQGRHHHVGAGTFISGVDGLPWYEVPFAYDPWWEAKSADA